MSPSDVQKRPTLIGKERNVLSKNKRREGGIYEEIAAEWLKKQGLVILERNFRCRQGEIDLIARDNNYLVFVEIKYRKTKGSGWAVEAVDRRKQEKIRKVALYYIVRTGRPVESPYRFDVLGFDGSRITWIKNAYEEQR